MRHADVPASRWNVIVDFSNSKQFLPPGRFHWPSMAASDLAEICKKKKTKTSHGLDGVKLSGLRKMPPPVLDAFCQMFQASETKGALPEQLVCGKVVSLAKVATPGTPSDFRPINLASCIVHGAHIMQSIP